MQSLAAAGSYAYLRDACVVDGAARLHVLLHRLRLVHGAQQAHSSQQHYDLHAVWCSARGAACVRDLLRLIRVLWSVGEKVAHQSARLLLTASKTSAVCILCTQLLSIALLWEN